MKDEKIVISLSSLTRTIESMIEAQKTMAEAQRELENYLEIETARQEEGDDDGH